MPFLIQVYALDPFGNIDTNYTGTVTFTSSDAAATLPDNYAFQPGDAGVATFTITLNTLDDQTLTATDIGDNSITGTTAVTVIPPGGRLGTVSSCQFLLTVAFSPVSSFSTRVGQRCYGFACAVRYCVSIA